MRASLRQMLPQILFWLMTIFITHYLTKVSPIRFPAGNYENFKCKETNLSNTNHYEPVHVPAVENDFPDFGDGPGIVSYDNQGKSGGYVVGEQLFYLFGRDTFVKHSNTDKKCLVCMSP